MTIAGPVFTEWYWGPIFFLLLYGPPIAVVAAALFVVSRRWGRSRTRAGLSLVVATVLVLAGSATWQHVRFERAEARDARTVGFSTFEPRGGAGFEAERAQVHASPGRSRVAWLYERFSVTQSVARRLDLVAPECSASEGGRNVSIDGPCELRRTARGRDVLLVRDDGLLALGVLDGTFVAAVSFSASEADLLRYFDALEPVPAAGIDFKR